MIRTRFLLMLLLGGLFGKVSGQICNGSLGDNIFTDGDFGFGTANILQTDPRIAPGYIYAYASPVPDGRYTITNDLRQWADPYDWIQIQDNSLDPRGYMMIVNASYDPGLFYWKRVEGLCENTLYTFSADIHNLAYQFDDRIYPNVSFLIDSQVRYNTGNIPRNERWNTYGFNFTTGPGQTSVILSLRNNAPGGIGNDIALDNISFRACGPLAGIAPGTPVTICEGDPNPTPLSVAISGPPFPTPVIQWQQSLDSGQTWLDIPGATGNSIVPTVGVAGIVLYRYLMANSPSSLSNAKCRIISDFKAVSVEEKFFPVTDSLCEGLSYTLGPVQYATTGRYTDTLTNARGCDSIVTLDLTMIEDNGLRAAFGLFNPSCHDLTDGSIRVDTVFSSSAPYRYFLDSTEITGSATPANLDAGTYSFSILDRYGCRLDTSFQLNRPAPFTLDLSPDGEVFLGEYHTVFATGSDSIWLYSWNPDDLVSCDLNCSPARFIPPRDMYLTLTGYNENGCPASDSVYIKVKEARKAFFPNAFTPNGDGLNDYFFVVGSIPNVKGVDRMTIFDRWGGVIYEKQGFQINNPEGGWDGTANGKAVPEGVYVYQALVRFADDLVLTYTGSLTLYR